MSKKKILHIQVLPKLSGVQKISLEIFRALPSDQYEKWILFSDSLDTGDKQACQEAFEQAGAKVLFSSNLRRSIGFRDWNAAKEIYRLCRAERFDIVHTHSTKPGIIGRLAATWAKVPLVIHTVHGLAFHKFVRFPQWQFYWVCEMLASCFCDRIVLVNRFYSKYFKWFRKKTSTIYNGVDFRTFPAVEPRVTDDVCNVLFVGRLDTPKDPLTLLRAAKIVLSQRDDIRFTLVGDGEKYDECFQFICQNNMSDRVKLVGWQNSVSSYYASHHLFVAPSIYESFGLMFVEAGYYGLPVISTNVEGIPEVVQNGVTGFLCKPRNERQIAERIISLSNNKELMLRMGEAARQRVTLLFDARAMTEQYIKVYNHQ